MNKIVKVITASVLTVSMCGCAVSADEAKSTATADTVSAEKKSSKKDAREAYTSQQTGKDETVYVFTGADGSMNHMVVSDTLHTAGKKGAVEDYSNLDNIENVSGDEKYSSDDNGNITWTSDGSDISYQGTTDKELPVDVKITYYLNGNEVSPEEIKGQSGHVKVHFDYTNNAETTITSNGEEKTVKVPFGMVTGLTLDASKFTNVTVTNGKMNQYNDSDVIYGLALPGLKESLETASVSDIDLTSVNIPEYFEFEADTTDFDIDLCMTIATSNLLSLLNTDDLNISDFSGSIDQLTSSGQKLVDGTKSLKDGTSQLKSGADSLDSGAQSLLNGAGTLSDGASSLSTGTNDLANGAQSLSDGASQVNDGASQLKDGAQSLADGTASLATGAQSALDGANQVYSGLSLLHQNSAALRSGTESITAAILSNVQKQLAAADPSFKTELNWENYAKVLGGYSGVTSSEKEKALSGVASQMSTAAGKTISTDTAALALQLSAQKYGSDAALDTANITAVLTELNNVNEKSGKISKAQKDASNYSDLLTKVLVTSIANATKVTDNMAKKILARAIYLCNEAKGTDIEPYVATAAKTPELLASFDDTTVNDLVSKYIDQILSTVAESVKDSGVTDDTIARKNAAVIITYACENYNENETLTQNFSDASSLLAEALEVSTAEANLKSAGNNLVDGIGTSLVTSSSSYSTLTKSLKSAIDQLNQVNAYRVGMESYIDGVEQLYSKFPTLQSGLTELRDGAVKVNDGAQSLKTGAETLAAGTKSLADGSVSLNDGAQKLKSGAATLYNGSLTLYSGVKTLKNGTASLKSGVVTLDEGAATLEAGMEQFYEEGIKKIGDVLGEDLPAVVDSLKGLTNAGADYKTFSGALDDNNNSCKFIFKTEFDSDNN